MSAPSPVAHKMSCSLNKYGPQYGCDCPANPRVEAAQQAVEDAEATADAILEAGAEMGRLRAENATLKAQRLADAERVRSACAKNIIRGGFGGMASELCMATDLAAVLGVDRG